MLPEVNIQIWQVALTEYKRHFSKFKKYLAEELYKIKIKSN